MRYQKGEKDANYDLPEKKEPSTRMGQSSFANMPDKPIMKAFSKKHGYRDGIVNDYSCSLDETSGIDENHVSR
jgi:hypothetical protein